MSQIYIAVCNEIKPGDALAKITKISETKPFLLAYSPSRCCFTDQCEADVFEYRCFCEEYELRWVRERGKDTGKAVLIAEREYEIDGFEVKESSYDLSRDDHYLLWGTKKRITENGETVLFDHRVGDLRVPLSISGARAYLQFREYFSLDEYGNYVLKTERCRKLEDTPSEVRLLPCEVTS